MSLGERISYYRKCKALTQEDLANILNVSRQAIYKWESGQSTPELEKLLAMSSIFEISLDELIKGEQAVGNEMSKAGNDRFSKHHVSALLFLTTGIIIAFILSISSGSFWGVVPGLPFIVCALLCFLAPAHTALWCGWTFYVFADLYIKSASRITMTSLFQKYMWTDGVYRNQLIFEIVQLLVILFMIALTVTRLGSAEMDDMKQSRIHLVISVIVLAALSVLNQMNLLGHLIGEKYPHSILFPLCREFHSLLMIAAAVHAVRIIMGMIKKKRS